MNNFTKIAYIILFIFVLSSPFTFGQIIDKKSGVDNNTIQQKEEVGVEPLYRIEVLENGTIKVYDMQGNLVDTTMTQKMKNESEIFQTNNETSPPSYNYDTIKKGPDLIMEKIQESKNEEGLSSPDYNEIRKSKDLIEDKDHEKINKKPDEESEKLLHQQYLNNMEKIKQNSINKLQNKQNFEELYQSFLNNQQSPLYNAHTELFNLDDQIWQRYYGEKEYFLAPSVSNIREYNKRIKQYNNKQSGIIKSYFSIIDVEITNESKRLLSEMGITVPSYINNTIKVILPQIDIDRLIQNNINIHLNEDYGKNTGVLQNNDINEIQETIWSEGWEGSLAPYERGDANATNGLDYWGDVSCDAHSGSWSLYCAGEGDQPDCVNYDNNMDAYVYTLSGIDVSGYTNVQFSFWLKYNTELSFDVVNRWFSGDGTNWTLSTIYSGNSSGWGQRIVNLMGFTNYYWEFDFSSDGSINNYEGAYLDDMIITGDATGLPNLVVYTGSGSVNSFTYNTSTHVIDATNSVGNNGTASSGSFRAGWYLSTNSTISTTDELIVTSSQSSLTNGFYKNVTVSADLDNVNPPAGTYYLGNYWDDTFLVTESNEADNTGYFSSPQITWSPSGGDPNLTVYTGSGSVNSFTYNTTTHVIDVTNSVQNNGTVPSGSFRAGWYLSTNSTITTADELIVTSSQSSLTNGFYRNVTVSADLDNVDPSAGTYYLGNYWDDTFLVTETNETDNTGYFSTPQITWPPIALEPDINVFPTSLTINQTQMVNQSKINVHIYKERLIDLSTPYVEGQVVVKFNPEKEFIFRIENNISVCGISEVDQVLNELKVYSAEKIYKRSSLPNGLKNTLLLTYSKSLSIKSVIEKLLTLNDVEWVHPDYIYKINDQPNDPDFTNQWYLTKVFSNQAWDLGVGDPNIIIGIIDTGVDWDHPDLQNSVWTNPNEIPGNGIDDDANGYIDDIRGWDWVTNVSDPASGEDGQTPDNNPMDFNGHGTHCSGIAGATTNNGTGIAGISRGCRIMCLRAGYEASDGNGYVIMSAAASAIDYAIEMGARVISMSFGAGSVLLTPVTDAYNNGIVVVHAGGNDNSNIGDAIDGITQTISVAATDENDIRASFSNYGSWIDVSAPGVNIFSTVFDDTYASYNGTSMSAPLVAGLAALIISQDQSFNPDQVTSIIKNSADNIDNLNPSYISQLGTGRINAYNALSLISNGNTFAIENIGNEDLSITDISENVDWLSTAGYPSTPFNISPSGSQTVTVNVNWNLLGGSQQTGTITIASNDPDEPTVTVNVTAIPTPSQPILSVSPNNRDVNSSAGTTSFDVSNTGTGTMNWTVSVTFGDSWLTITSGSSGTNSGTINCSFLSNPNSSQRVGTITVTAPGATGSSKDVTVTQAPSSSTEYSISILPNTQTVAGIINTLIPLEIKIGDPNPIVSPDNFYGVSFNLNWDNTEYIEFSGDYTAGSWLGSNPLTLIQSFTDHIDAGLSRTTGGGVTGNGIVLLCSLKVKAIPTSDITANLTLTNIVATQSDGSSLNLLPTGTSTVTITIGTPVWAGDANNNGVVNAADILPLGLYYNKSGPSRDGGSCSWGTYPPGESQLCPPGWDPEISGLADCNGDGTVNATDVLCIGLNYGRTHGDFAILSSYNQNPLTKDGTDIPVLRFHTYDINNKQTSINKLKTNDNFYLAVSINKVSNILGISLDVCWKDLNENLYALKVLENDGNSGVSFADVWGTEVISISKPLEKEGKIGIGITKTDRITLTQQNSELFRIKMKVLDDQNLCLIFENIYAIDENGNAINIRGIPLEKGLSQISETVPNTYQLSNYPNPFNPATTIQVGLPYKSKVVLTIYNSLGQMVIKLVDGVDLEAGIYEYEWDAANMPSGIYIYQLLTNKYSKTMKMLLIK